MFLKSVCKVANWLEENVDELYTDSKLRARFGNVELQDRM